MRQPAGGGGNTTGDKNDTLGHSTTEEMFDHSTKLLFLMNEIQHFVSGRDMLALSLVSHQMFDVVSKLVSFPPAFFSVISFLSSSFYCLRQNYRRGGYDNL